MSRFIGYRGSGQHKWRWVLADEYRKLPLRVRWLGLASLVAAVAAIVFSLGFALHSVRDTSAAPLAGAIFTTTPDGGIVNENVHYQRKIEVYLDGGPGPNAPQTAAGLPDGNYYFQVTDPSGSVLLSEDPAKCREIRVQNGVIVQLVSIGRTYGFPKTTACSIQDPPTPPYDPNTIPGVAGPSGRHDTNVDKDHGPPAIVVQLMPFFDTPNPGGVYKAWIIPVGRYVANGGSPEAIPRELKVKGKQVGFVRDPGFGPPRDQVKTDNFKVKEFFPPEIKVRKFHDIDGDGIWDPGEPEIGVDQCVDDGGRIIPCPGGWPYDFTEPVDGGTVTNRFYTPHTHVAGIPGTYTPCELRLRGWLQTAAYLDGVRLDEQQCVDVPVAGISGEKHEVIFGNFRPGRLDIVKMTEGVNAPSGVTFTVSPNPYLGLVPALVPLGCDSVSPVLRVTDGGACDQHDAADGNVTLINIRMGDYSVHEPTPPRGTAFLRCEPVPAPVAVGGTATVTCYNKLAHLEIRKVTDGIPTPGVTFTVEPNPYVAVAALDPRLVPAGCDYLSPVLRVTDGDACDRHDGADGIVKLVNILGGDYRVGEPVPPPGTAFDRCEPNPVTVLAGRSGSTTCHNKLANLKIRKVTDGVLTPGITFTVDPNPYVAVHALDPRLVPPGCDSVSPVLRVTDGDACDRHDGADGVVGLVNILGGDYRVDEPVPPPGTHFAGCRPNPVPVPPGGSGETTCTNKLAELIINKVTDGTLTPGVTFTVEPNPYVAVAALDPRLVPAGCDSVSPVLTVTDGDACDRHDRDDGIVKLVNILAGVYRVDEPIPPRGTHFEGCDPNPVPVPAGGSGETTCTNIVEGPTRTPGFWMTHTQVTEDAFDAIGPIDLGYVTLTRYEDVFGIFYASNHFFEDGSPRDNVCQARVIGSFQLLAAIFNAEYLGTRVPTDPVTGLDLITATRQAMAAGDAGEILRLSELLDDYNNSGDEVELGFEPGPATPQESQALADDPTDPGNCSLSDLALEAAIETVASP